jgi:hypothetical protein
VYVNIAKTGTSEVLFVPEYNTWGGGAGGGTKDPPPPRRVAWKKLRKERKKFSKLLIFITDCRQPMGLQSVIKIRGKTSKLFALHASPYKGSTPGWILATVKIILKFSTKFSTWYILQYILIETWSVLEYATEEVR